MKKNDRKIRLYVFGYRDQYFWNLYGPIVRDLMVVNNICDHDKVDKVFFYNRPISIHEKILGKKKRLDGKVNDKLEFCNKLSLDIIGPFKRRLWLNEIYEKSYIEDPKFSSDYVNVILDFLPIGHLPSWTQYADIYWYDLIDNFTKHNRFTDKEKSLVKIKYEEINSKDNVIITGVSDSALDYFKQRKYVVPNALSTRPKYYNGGFKFDFGFMGFITDKFDIVALKSLSDLGYSIAIYGEFYDKKIEVEVSKIKNVHTFGKFTLADVDNILSTFKVGLVPYIINKLHDESPLKIFQYISSGKNVLSSYDFDLSDEGISVYHQNDIKEKAELIINRRLLTIEQANRYYAENSWSQRIENIVEVLESCES